MAAPHRRAALFWGRVFRPVCRFFARFIFKKSKAALCDAPLPSQPILISIPRIPCRCKRGGKKHPPNRLTFDLYSRRFYAILK
jgi:hypothetical protein